MRRIVPMLVAGAALVAGCTTAPTGGEGPTASGAPTTIDDYPDAITRELDRMASAPRPVEPSAMPPRHRDADTFPTTLVDRDRIVFGGAPPDGIPPIDEPRYESASEVDWLEPNDPVIVLAHAEEVRAYPVQVLIWHEIVNDELGGAPVAVTYCPLCNSGVAFDRSVAGDVLDFGTSGALYQANLVMYDRQTESLWTQFDGRAVVGTRVGDQLRLLPTSMVSWGDYLAAHPDDSVLARDVVDPKPYGSNPYAAYDQRTATVDGFFAGDADATLLPYERVVGIDLDGSALAVPTARLAEVGALETTHADMKLTIWHRPGTASALNAPQIADGDDVGATAVFVAEVAGGPASFSVTDGGFVDDVTQTVWNIFGEAVAGPLDGERLRPVTHVDTFWFAWATFRPGGALLEPTATSKVAGHE